MQIDISTEHTCVSLILILKSIIFKSKEQCNEIIDVISKLLYTKFECNSIYNNHLAKEITSVVHFIFTQSLYTGELPTEWTQAIVAPIFKKGSKLQAVNYRPVSLTCITCKLFEHIICKHILAHLEDHNILTDLQHGVRSGRSCETQLVTTFQDLAQMHNKKGSQIDIADLDFSKDFDTVPHDGLLSKLQHYGIDEKI